MAERKFNPKQQVQMFHLFDCDKKKGTCKKRAFRLMNHGENIPASDAPAAIAEELGTWNRQTKQYHLGVVCDDEPDLDKDGNYVWMVIKPGLDGEVNPIVHHPVAVIGHLVRPTTFAEVKARKDAAIAGRNGNSREVDAKAALDKLPVTK